MNTIKLIAGGAHIDWAGGRFRLKNRCLHGVCVLATAVLLSACATPQPPALKAVYDFGPLIDAPANNNAGNRANAALPLIALALPEIESGAGLDSPALLYRLQYADAQQLRPYATVRWSVPPAQLIRTRLRDALSAQANVLPQEGNTAFALRAELDEFSHVFSSPEASQGLVRLRVSLLKDDKLIQQTSISARAPAPSQDAPGGVRALTAATDDAVRQIAAWLTVQRLKTP
jgi:cholesterol transport system auxiliary component